MRLHQGDRRRPALRLRERVPQPGVRQHRSRRQDLLRRRIDRPWPRPVLSEYLNRTGSIIVLLTLMMLAVILSTQFSFGRMFATRTANSQNLSARGIGWMRAADRARRKETQRSAPRYRQAREEGGRPSPAGRVQLRQRTRAGAPRVRRDADRSRHRRRRAPPRRSAPPSRGSARSAAPSPLAEPKSRRRRPAEAGRVHAAAASLLDAPKAERKIDERELMDAARLLEEKCREFAVEGQVAQIHPGPVVTTFEFKPDAGVKYSKVTGLADDLCLAMQAESVLIDRIPGKSTVGIQIPNPNREAISLRELLESDAYQRSTSKLTLALGKTIHGEPYVTDLATMPHLLIAGSTGTGKSVGLNAMLTSILYRATPDDVRMIMIDPKRLELGMYEEIPHLLTPVVVDPKKAANALRWAVARWKSATRRSRPRACATSSSTTATSARDHERGSPGRRGRAEAAAVHRRRHRRAGRPDDGGEQRGRGIDRRLAQMARAVGIHLILATQRPSVDVITGLIKANLPSRISFRVSSKIDSRTILDGNGAEQLLGKGDMLFLPPASSRSIRLHGPYISEQESARLASFLRKQGKPIFDDTITAEDEKKRPGGSSSRRTTSTTKPRASSSAAVRCRSRICSASCGSASAAPRGSWT